MSYCPPRLPWIAEEDFDTYQHVMANAYRYHDAMLGTLLEFADSKTSVILMSDHGFHPDHLRPGYIPAEPAGPAVEHRHFGILCLKGPTLRSDETDRKSTRLNSSHSQISYAVFCLKKKKQSLMIIYLNR